MAYTMTYHDSKPDKYELPFLASVVERALSLYPYLFPIEQLWAPLENVRSPACADQIDVRLEIKRCLSCAKNLKSSFEQ